jgi:hypothetical protein
MLVCSIWLLQEEVNASTEGIALLDKLPWPETFVMSSEVEEVDATDDLARENHL